MLWSRLPARIRAGNSAEMKMLCSSIRRPSRALQTVIRCADVIDCVSGIDAKEGGEKKKTDDLFVFVNEGEEIILERVAAVESCVSEICTGAAVPELDGLASSGKDKEVKSEEGRNQKTDGPFFKHIITDYIFREETVKKAIHVTLFFWCKGSKSHFAVGPQDSLSFPRRRASTLLFLFLPFVFKPDIIIIITIIISSLSVP